MSTKKKPSEMTPEQRERINKRRRELYRKKHKLPKKSNKEKVVSKLFQQAPKEKQRAYLQALKTELIGLTGNERARKKHCIYKRFFITNKNTQYKHKTPEEKEQSLILMAKRVSDRYRERHPEKAEYFKALDQYMEEHGNPTGKSRERLRTLFYEDYYADKRKERQREYQRQYKERHKEQGDLNVLGTIYKYPINIPTDEYTEGRDNYVADRKQAVLQMFKTYKGDYDKILQEVDGLIDNAKIDERLNDKFRYHELVFLNQLCRYLYQFTPESIQQEQERARQAEYYHEKAKEFLTRK